MCDYSLHAVSSRPAVVAEKLTSTRFRNTETRGFAAIGEPAVAVCIRPGTELAFETEVTYRRFLGLVRGRTGQRLARFRQININDANRHHDALEFPDGKIILVNDLIPGQKATVLQMPSDAGRAIEHDHEKSREASAAR
jgi:hypothetical protein